MYFPKRIYVKKPNDVNTAWGDGSIGVAIAVAPIGIKPTTFTAVKAAGGSLADDTYYYSVTAIGVNGETLGATEASATTSAADNTVTLGWDSQDDVVFRVYRGLATGVYTHYYDVTTNSLSDDGTIVWLAGDVFPTVAPSTTAYAYSLVQSIIKVEPVFIPASSATINPNELVSKVLLTLSDGTRYDIDLLQVLNQSTWNTGTQAATLLAASDIMSW